MKKILFILFVLVLQISSASPVAREKVVEVTSQLVESGKIEIRKVCDFGINLDERIADGFYFTKSLEYFRYVLEHPELLEENANVAIDIKK